MMGKEAMRYAQPFTFAALRSFLGAASLFALLFVLRRPTRPRVLGPTLVLGLLQTTGMVGLAMWALESGGAGKTSVLIYTMPFWLLLMAWLVLGERLQGLQWLGVALVFCGLLAMLSPWELRGFTSSLLALGSGLVWAASAVWAKILRKRHEVDLLALTAWQMLLGSIPLIVVAVVTFTRSPDWSISFIGALAYFAVLADALCWFLWLYVLHALPAGTAGIAILATPVVGVVSAWVQLGERPGLGDAIGMGLIVCALSVMTAREIIPRRRALGSARVTES